MKRNWIPLLLGLFSASWLIAAEPDRTVQRDIPFTTLGDVTLTLDLHLPKEGKRPHPAVVWVHGGGFVSGDKQGYAQPIMDPLFTAGFAMVSVNYRLAPKYPFPACVDDVETAIAFIKSRAKEWGIDPDRLVLMGDSAGGLIVSVVGGRAKPQNRVAAVISLYGEHDLITRVTENPCIMDGRAVPIPPGGCLSPGLAALLGIQSVTADTMKIIREASAVTYVRKQMPPYLLIHGTREFHVPFEQAVSMQEAMKRAGADCTLIPILGGSHGVGGWEKLPQATEYKGQTLAWLRSKLRLGQ